MEGDMLDTKVALQWWWWCWWQEDVSCDSHLLVSVGCVGSWAVGTWGNCGFVGLAGTAALGLERLEKGKLSGLSRLIPVAPGRRG